MTMTGPSDCTLYLKELTTLHTVVDIKKEKNTNSLNYQWLAISSQDLNKD